MDTYKQFEIKEGIVFLIEVTPDLLTTHKDIESCQLLEILRAINDLMADLVITMKATGVGIYLYNLDETASKAHLKPVLRRAGLYKLFSMNSLNTTNMKLLSDLVVDVTCGSRAIDDLFVYRAPEGNHLASVLGKVLDDFMAKPYFNVRRCMWFTANDQPYDDNDAYVAARRVIDDFYSYGYTVSPLFLAPKDKTFDMTKYRDLFLNTNYLSKNDTGTRRPRKPVFTTQLNSQIRASILRIKEVRRQQFSCNLVLSDGPGVGAALGCTVRGYTLYQPERLKTDLHLYSERDTLKKVHLESRMIAADEEVKLEDTVRGFSVPGGVVVVRDDVMEFMSCYVFDSGEREEKGNIQKENTKDYKEGYQKGPKDHKENDQQEPHVKQENNHSNNQLLAGDETDYDESDEEDGENGDREELHKSEGLDDDNIYDSTDPLTYPPYLKLLCFRDNSAFIPVYNTSPPRFITADFDDGQGGSGGYTHSARTFASLYQSCVKLNKHAVVFGCTKKNSRPSIYAMMATASKDLPQGFLLMRMPWLDDIRLLPVMFGLEPFFHESADLKPDEYLERLWHAYTDLFSQFFVRRYVPGDNPNPTLNHFYDVVKHELLQIDYEEKGEAAGDASVRRLAELHARVNKIGAGSLREAQSVIQEYQQQFATESLPEPSPKRIKVGEVDVQTAYENDTLTKMTVAQLKLFLQSRGKNSGGKKAELVERVKDCMGEH